MDTTTAADFTIQIEIPTKLWYKWLQSGLRGKISFKEYFKMQIVKQVNKLPSVLKHKGHDVDAENVH